MSRNIPFLSPGDTVGICAPAKAIDEALVNESVAFLESNGFKVVVTPNCTGRHNYFSGTVTERLSDFQLLLDDPDVKAIWCARGGYGTVQIMDLLNWASFIRSPKWILGFSDVTFIHGKLNQLGYPSIHCTMPLNIPSNSNVAKSTLLDSIQGNRYDIRTDTDPNNRTGSTEAEIVGGNLSILQALVGTDDQPDFDCKILYIEDLCEHLYAIDRIMHTLRKSGALSNITGLIVGGMTDIKDTDPGFGFDIEALILEHFSYRKIPIAFNFPAGHIDDNRAIVFGRKARFEVSEEAVCLSFL
jgi:muramoyltetrapeptide carboxypeptidase